MDPLVPRDNRPLVSSLVLSLFLVYSGKVLVTKPLTKYMFNVDKIHTSTIQNCLYVVVSPLSLTKVTGSFEGPGDVSMSYGCPVVYDNDSTRFTVTEGD